MKIEALETAIKELKEVPFLMKTGAAEKVMDRLIVLMKDQERRIEKLEQQLLAVCRG